MKTGDIDKLKYLIEHHTKAANEASKESKTPFDDEQTTAVIRTRTAEFLQHYLDIMVTTGRIAALGNVTWNWRNSGPGKLELVGTSFSVQHYKRISLLDPSPRFFILRRENDHDEIFDSADSLEEAKRTAQTAYREMAELGLL